MTDSPPPYYMQEDASDEDGEQQSASQAADASEDQSDANRKEAVEAEVERQAEELKKKVQIGKVELDPKIGSWPSNAGACAERRRLCRLEQEWSGPRLQGQARRRWHDQHLGGPQGQASGPAQRLCAVSRGVRHRQGHAARVSAVEHRHLHCGLKRSVTSQWWIRNCR